MAKTSLRKKSSRALDVAHEGAKVIRLGTTAHSVGGKVTTAVGCGKQTAAVGCGSKVVVIGSAKKSAVLVVQTLGLFGKLKAAMCALLTTTAATIIVGVAVCLVVGLVAHAVLSA